MAEREFLLLRLAGALAAWGEIAVGERRGSWDVPSRSAALGLLAGALGLKRQAAAQADLDAALGFAVRQDQPGRTLRDYHTAQTPKSRRGARWETRREELQEDDLSTILSERIYRQEAVATFAFWVKDAGAAGRLLAVLPPKAEAEGSVLRGLAWAVRHPHFAPYLGRKACPPAAPPRPLVLAAPGLLAAFNAYDAAEHAARLAVAGGRGMARRGLLAPPDFNKARPVWFDIAAGLEAEEAAVVERRHRRDGVGDRAFWHFCDREEGRLVWQPATLDGIAGVAAGENP